MSQDAVVMMDTDEPFTETWPVVKVLKTKLVINEGPTYVPEMNMTTIAHSVSEDVVLLTVNEERGKLEWQDQLQQ